MSKGDFYENDFVTFDQYRELSNNYGFNLFYNILPRDIEAIKLEQHVKDLKDNTKLFSDSYQLNDEEYYRKTEQALHEKYTKLLVAESPYHSSILKKAGINGLDFIRFLQCSSGSESSVFYPKFNDNGHLVPVSREDFTQIIFGIGHTDFIIETIGDREFIIFNSDSLFI